MKQRNNKLEGKVVVITGASGGVGRATAQAFGAQGAKVALLARKSDALFAAAEEVEALGGTALAIPTDVAVAQEVDGAAMQVEQQLGPIDIWVNNAMNSVFAPLKEIQPDEFKRVTEVTYLGQVYGTLAALRYMLPRNSGSIILVGSALAYRGIPLQSAYCGAKHAVQGFFDSLRAELIHDKSNINLCMVQLPAMDTTQFTWVLSRLPKKPRPMGKIYRPEVAAQAIVFVSQHPRRELWVGYPTYQAIIGNKFIPKWLDSYLARTAIEGQQTSEPMPDDWQHNLWQPVQGDRGTYGGFGKEAHGHSYTLWMAMHRMWVWLGAAFALLLVVSLFYYFGTFK